MSRKPPSETSDADANSRSAKLVARRGRRTRVMLVVLVVAIGGAAAAGAFAYSTHDPQAHAAPPNTTVPGNFGRQGTLVAPAGIKTLPTRALSHADPLRLWIGGDSLAGSFGPALGDQVGGTGVAKTVVDYKVSSGLWSNDLRNWYQRATDQMASDNPDVAVFIVGANDAPIVNRVDNNGDGVPDWQVDYRLKVDRMMMTLVGPGHRTVLWLGPPTLGDHTMNSGAKALGDLMRREATKFAPDVTFLDTYKLFSDSNGDYSRHILDENGKEITARISDGVHFTEDGAQYLARAVFALIDNRWRLTKQADLLEPIGWTLAAGSGESVPGFSSAPKSRYHQSRNNSTGTTYHSVSPTSGVFGSSTVVVPSTAAPTTVGSTAPPVTVTTKPTTPTTHSTPTTHTTPTT
jgi:hypothetical protein